MSHTLGPWEWEPGKGMWRDAVSLASIETGETVLSLGAVICTGSLEVRIEASMDDAALIAAAPNLLTACRALVNAVLLEKPGEYHERVGQAIDQAEAAITKTKPVQ